LLQSKFLRKSKLALVGVEGWGSPQSRLHGEREPSETQVSLQQWLPTIRRPKYFKKIFFNLAQNIFKLF